MEPQYLAQEQTHDKCLSQLKDDISHPRKKVNQIFKMALVPLGKSLDDVILDPGSSSKPPGLRR
jgi:hypothetical protein